MSRELLKKACEFLGNPTLCGEDGADLYEKIQAELAKPVPEPGAWECTRGGFTELTVVHPSKVWGNGFKNVKELYYQPPAQPDAERYRKLRAWMSSNVKEGWQEVERLGAIAAYVNWDEFDKYLDELPECNVGLCERRAK